MRTSLLLGLSLYAVTSGLPALPQVQGTGAARTRIEGIDIPNVPNAPFTAKVVVTWDQPLVGGGMESRKYYTLVARDSKGRVHRETRGFLPATSDAEPPLQSIIITDPISGTRTTCMDESMSCATSPFHPRQSLTPLNALPLPEGGGNARREDLGTRTINGLSAVGTRDVVKGVSGSRGSSRLALTYTETWYSPDLQMALSVVRTSPQLGQVTLTVADLQRGDPDQSWFAVPSGFEVKTSGSN